MQALTTELSACKGVTLKELRGCPSGDLRPCFHRHNLIKFGLYAFKSLCCFPSKHFSDVVMSLKISHDHGIEESVACPLVYVVNIEKPLCTSASSILRCVNCRVNCLFIGPNVTPIYWLRDPSLRLRSLFLEVSPKQRREEHTIAAL